MKNILITIFYADGLHGGVKYSAELGQYLNSIGYNVYICGVVTNDKTKAFFEQYNIKMFNVSEMPTDIYFDLIWAHHWPILPYLLRKGLQYHRLINSCISEFLPIDKPLFFTKSVDLFLTLTPKTKDMFINKYDIDGDIIHVLPNTAPDYFFDYQHDYARPLKSIAVVSNHIPTELAGALDILNSKGYNTIVYGGKNPVDIVPAVLTKHDVIVSIGKTVQYSLAMGIPVYNYDHFGGSGYITPENINVEESANFSGRSFFTKKTSEQIANEIVSQYYTALTQSSKLKNTAKKRYKLSTKINEILNIVNNVPLVKHVVENNSNRLYFDYCEFVINFSAVHISDMPQRNKRKKESRTQRLYRHIKTFISVPSGR